MSPGASTIGGPRLLHGKVSATWGGCRPLSCPFNNGHGAVAAARLRSFDISSAARRKRCATVLSVHKETAFARPTFCRDYCTNQLGEKGCCDFILFYSRMFTSIRSTFNVILHTPLHSQITHQPEDTAKRTLYKSCLIRPACQGTTRANGRVGCYSLPLCKYRGVKVPSRARALGGFARAQAGLKISEMRPNNRALPQSACGSSKLISFSMPL